MINQEFVNVDEKIIILNTKALERLILALKVCVEGFANNQAFKQSKVMINNKSISCNEAQMIAYDFIKTLEMEM